MDSEHESEDEFNANNDDTRTEDGSDRGEPEEDPAMNAPSDTVAKQDDVAQRTHKPLVLQSHALDCKTFDIIPLVLAVHPCNIYCMAATQCRDPDIVLGKRGAAKSHSATAWRRRLKLFSDYEYKQQYQQRL
ncbi:hypothetical protein BGZ82_000964 [Podila clonocystis]|nr:hypothetical protein BGZ82_000964 [Podila clonocystis]